MKNKEKMLNEALGEPSIKIYEPIMIDDHELKVYDNGGETADRFTVTYSDSECLCLSDDFYQPNGFSMLGNYLPGKHLGKEIDFNDLSGRMQDHIIERFGLQFN